MARRALWAVPLAVLLAACGSRVATSTTTSPGDRVPVHALAKHRVVSDISLDSGALTAHPPGTEIARYSLSRANKIVLAAYSDVANGTTYDPALVALGRVTISLKPTRGLPAYHDRLAWIGFFEQFTSPPCPSTIGTSSPTTEGRVRRSHSSVWVHVGAIASSSPFFYVVVLDAETGKGALVYQTRGIGDCGGPVRGPYLSRATELLSVPWTAVGEQPLPPSPPVYLPGGNTTPTLTTEWTIRYTMPACGRLRMVSGPGPEAVFVDIEVPIDVPSHCSPAHSVTTTLPSFGGELDHAPTGLTSGVSVDDSLQMF